MQEAMHIVHVVGARPNFVKVAPVLRALAEEEGCRQTLVHTGQHYDWEMSQVFFEQIGLPSPDVNLEVGSGSQARQTAEVMIRLEPVVLQERPDLVLVYGDVNSTVAAALVCAKLDVPVGHVEAGLRSFDRAMPEEINRVMTDHLSELLFTHCADADQNLAREGIAPDQVFRVGNVMIDTLVRLLPLARQRSIHQRLGLANGGPAATRYGVVTLHRPSNVDEPAILQPLLLALSEIAQSVPLIFPVHPRTRQHLGELGLPGFPPGLHLIEPLGYLDFLALEERAVFVITDSGGIQEETTYLGVSCLTVRPNTERPVTVTEGTNTLVGCDWDQLRARTRELLAGHRKPGRIPELWDGQAALRIAKVVRENSRARARHPSRNDPAR